MDHNNILLKIGESVYKVERKSVSSFIQKVLHEEDILTEYLYKLDFYDEKTDGILIMKALKVIKNFINCNDLSF